MKTNKKEKIDKQLNLRLLEDAEKGSLFSMIFFSLLNEIPRNVILNHVVENKYKIKVEYVPFGNCLFINIHYENKQENIFFQSSISANQATYACPKLKEVKERNTDAVWDAIMEMDRKPKEDYKKKYILNT